MNALARWNQSRWKQLNEVEALQQSLGRLSGRCGVHWPEQPLPAPQRIPLVAVSENARRCALKAEQPQVKQEDVKITLDDDTLTITGDRTFDVNRKKGQPRFSQVMPLSNDRHCPNRWWAGAAAIKHTCQEEMKL